MDGYSYSTCAKDLKTLRVCDVLAGKLRTNRKSPFEVILRSIYVNFM